MFCLSVRQMLQNCDKRLRHDARAVKYPARVADVASELRANGQRISECRISVRGEA